MADLPTFDDLFRIARDEALLRNSRLSRDVIEREGTDANVLLAAACAAADEVVGQLAVVAAGLFLDSAAGDALDKRVFDLYSLARKSAAPAVGSVEFSTTAPAAAVFTIPSGTQLQTTDDTQFITTAAVVFPLGAVGPITVPVRSVLAGADQQAQKNTITAILGAIPGQPTDLVVTNSLATFGAADEESDAHLRDRARSFYSTARRGTLDSIEQGALSVAGVERAQAFEVVDMLGRAARLVLLAISDAFTDQLVSYSIAGVPAYAAQSYSISQQVQTALREYRAAGIAVDVQVAQVVLVAVNLALTFYAGVDYDAVAVEARAVVVALINSLAPGAMLTVDMILTALRSVRGLIVTGSEVLTPVGSVEPLPLQVLRSMMEMVLVTGLAPSQSLKNTGNADAYRSM